jgi:Zn-dependent peptidase ImmA (M78 family)
MDRVPAFNPSRLTIARKKRRFSRIGLARASGLAVRSIAYYESGQVAPSDDAINSLASALRFHASFFFGPDMEEPNCDGASFRSLSATAAIERDAALASGALAIELSGWIEERFELPEPTVPSLRGFDAETAAQALRAEWGLEARPIKNVVHVLEAHGVRVFSLPVDSASVDAFSVWHRDKPFVFLNTMKSGERGRMDTAHELAHLTLHRHGGPRGRRAEFEADRFASAFLMPAADVLAHVPRAITLNTILHMKRRWGTAAIALVHRLHSLQILTEWQYRALCIELSKLGFRRSEPDGIIRDDSQALTKVFAALKAEGVSRAAVARELRIDTTELDAMLVGLVIASVAGGRIEDRGIPQGKAGGQRPDLRIV